MDSINEFVEICKLMFQITRQMSVREFISLIYNLLYLNSLEKQKN